ncbi:nucleotidyltransferase family protein [Candidatus Leptofilum sp.]|uniref:nucleotidyltransferase family protein n=1 Tax=Candidatus Leptofilum sp. TaxID=3241576 RepID=UPI003B58B850
MQELNRRPQLPAAELMRVTNTLARWLPGGEEPAIAAWSQAEWEAALWVVYWQNALPWLAVRVREEKVEIPKEVNGRLQAISRASRERTRRMLDSCTEILAAFQQAGIEVLLLKGAVLAPLYYPDPFLRPLADLDLLIRPKDVVASREIMLKKLGYRYYSRSAEDEVYLRGERKPNIWAPDNVHPVAVVILRCGKSMRAWDMSWRI